MIKKAGTGNTGGNGRAGAPSPNERSGIAKSLYTGFATVALVFAGLGGWAASAPIAGAVVTPGTVVVSSNVKPV